MAKLSSDKTYVTVEKGDTLGQIAIDYAGGYSNYKKLAAINGISDPNRIYVGQKIYLSGSSGSSTSSSSNSNTVTIKQFGLQSNTERTLFATWDWNKSNTDHYRVRWLYGTGDDVAFVGSDTTTTEKQALFTIPEQASTRVIFKVLPVSKTKTDKNNKTTSYWTAQWSPEKYYYINSLPPTQPPVPDVEIKDYTLTATLDNIGDLDAKSIEFEVYKNDTTKFKTGTANVSSTGFASYSCTVSAGAEYKVRCRAVRGDLKSDWSDFSGNSGTKPAAPTGITKCKATSSTSVYLEWSKVANAESYDIEYATEKEYLGASTQSTIQSTTDATTHYTITNLSSGEEYFFRVRAKNTSGDSAWTAIRSVIIGKDPAAPTTWSSTTTAIVGEVVVLYWIHNSEDGSKEKQAEVEVTINGSKTTTTIENADFDNDEKEDEIRYHVLSTSSLSEGAKITWRVRTMGVTGHYGDWSIERSVDVYAPPTLEFHVVNKNDTDISIIDSFPFYVKGFAGPATQSPIGYSLVVTSNDVYETVDQIGNPIIINKGEQVYSRYFDTNEPLIVELSAGNIDLENNISYTITCTVSMNSGLTAEESTTVTVYWTENKYYPNAEIGIDKTTFSATIRPYCEYISQRCYEVTKSGNKYYATSNLLGTVYGIPESDVNGNLFYVEGNGKQVFYGVTEDDTEVYYYIEESGTLVDNVTLSLYRREYDGSFTEIAKDLDNTKHTYVTDPHPALDYARYRVVAKTNDTGAISYYDLPGYPVNGIAVIIQWNERWSNFDVISEDPLAEPEWAGSMLTLPYNIDVSDKSSPDVSLVEYVGRKHPVSYYGTQVGETSTWSLMIPKYDKETLYGLRRLAKWMGDVYVREPSGSGYWANINVSFSQKHLDTTIPVTLELTRVEGGI